MQLLTGISQKIKLLKHKLFGEDMFNNSLSSDVAFILI